MTTKEFEYTVDFSQTKDEYDNNSARAEQQVLHFNWLYDNVGEMAWPELGVPGVWKRDLIYSEDNKRIIKRYQFREAADATIFALKWL